MTTETPIRVGTPADVDDIMELALAACKENGFVNPNPIKLLEQIWPALNRDHGIIGVIGEPGQKAEGAILLRVVSMWYSDEQILEEKAIFIHPDYRSAKGGRARRLCEFAKHISDELGIPLLIGVLSNDRTEAKVRLYERQFGRPTGAFFLYNARTGEWAEAAE
jgi:GNAT superfamily N-acetyltransferase